jgi:hypothetical protein
MEMAFEEGLALGQNYPFSFDFCVLSEMLQKRGGTEAIAVSVSPNLTKSTVGKICGLPLLKAKHLKKGLIVHYSDGGALWWSGDNAPIEAYWPNHISPSAYAR